jgi:hypothetical protein
MTVRTVTNWAEHKINERTENDIFLGLSTARTTNEIVELLSDKVVWNYNDSELRNLLLSYYKRYLENNSSRWFEIEKELLEYFRLLEYDSSNESTQDFLYFLDDDWHLRKDGFDGLLSMPTYLTENLAEFKDLDNLKELLTEQGLSGYEV